MDFKTTTRGGVEVIYLSGRFDAFESPKLGAWFDASPDADRVIINLSGVNFIDSSGLASLVKGLKHCRQNGGDLYLCGLQQAVTIIFELTGLHKAFNIFPDEDAAVNAFAIPAGS